MRKLLLIVYLQHNFLPDMSKEEKEKIIMSQVKFNTHGGSNERPQPVLSNTLEVDVS